jgi:acetylserotonin N-methyltransferase
MPADPTNVLDIMLGFRRSKTMFAGVELGVFDALQERPSTAEELALRLACNSSAMRRLLDALVGLNLLQREGDQYRNSAAADELLCTSSPNRLTGYIRFSNDASWKLWTYFEDSVREGSSRWHQAYGWDGPMFDAFFRDETAMREFLMGMNGYGVISSPRVVRAVDLSNFRHLCDLGGATGHLAIAACKAYSNLTATVFELPAVVPVTQEMIDLTDVGNRVSVIPGDFFENELPSADLYSLGRILHDWSDEKITLLLSKIFSSLPAGGGLLIAEIMVNPDHSGPVWAQMQDLNMLVCTDGRERTAAEYQTMLYAIGFEHVECQITGAPVDAILATKRR